MTDKERLEEHTHIAVKKDEYKKLKEQAERVQELEEWRNEVTNHVVKRNDEYAKCREQNKRYREQLELIRKDTFYEDHEFVSVRHLIRKRVDKALKGDKQ